MPATPPDPATREPAADWVSHVRADELVFRLPDPTHDLRDVHLWHDLDLPGWPHELAAVTGGWQLVWPCPPADRVEYQFTAHHPALGPDRAFLLDPGNPRTVDGAFGPHSWLPLPGYREPAWLGGGGIDSHHVAHTLTDTPVGDVDLVVWSPADAPVDEPLPMLLAHDGPELERYAGLTHVCAALVAQGRLPRLRVTLLAPGDRNPRYAANPAYALMLAEHLVPRLREAHPSEHPLVLAGPSLGGLAALHAEWCHPGLVGGLLLLSGSFFTPQLDGQESNFEFWSRIVDFVGRVHGAAQPPSRPVVAMGWGSVEENRHNNAALATRLGELGLPVRTATVRDGHNFTCWRDLLDPLLPDLLTSVWS